MPDPEPVDLGRPHHVEPGERPDDASAPALVLLHGAGGDEHTLVPLGKAIAPGAALLGVRGAHTDDRGASHLRRGEDRRIDADEAHAAAGELAGLVTDATEAYDLDPARLWWVGFGEGAAAVAALAVDRPDLVAGGVLLSGMAPFVDAEHRMLGGKAFFSAWGRNDEEVTLDEYEELVELLLSSGAEVVLRWYDVGHEVSDEERRDVGQWLSTQLAARTE